LNAIIAKTITCGSLNMIDSLSLDLFYGAAVWHGPVAPKLIFSMRDFNG